MKHKQNIKKIVLTGGPCAGKSTAMSIITQQLENLGWKVFICQEAATHLFKAGTEISEKGLSSKEFQEQIILHQIYEEDFLQIIAQQHTYENVAILLDRGIMDGMAYVPKEEFINILEKYNYDIVSVRDQRYDAIFHLVSAAYGAEQFYTLENNEARKESVEEARIIDDKTKSVWIGHPHMRVIDNTTSFKQKVDRLIKEIFSVLGLPIPIRIERKFTIEAPDITKIDIPYQVIDIQQHYLDGHNTKEHTRIRQRGQNGSYTYYHTKKINIRGGVNIELEDKISQEQYYDLLPTADPNLVPIIKERICFLWENQYFEMDIFKNRGKDTCMLQIKLTEQQQETILPLWIKIIKEVTDDSQYSNYELAKK